MKAERDSSERLFAIVRRPGGHLDNLCPGPLPDGTCARVESGTLPCAGERVIPLRGTAANGLPFTVPAGLRGPRCPMAWVDADDS